MITYDSIDASSNKPIIHFSHANSFPAASYRQLFEELSKNFQIIAVDRFGHDPDYPVNKNWDNQVQELIKFINSVTINLYFLLAILSGESLHTKLRA